MITGQSRAAYPARGWRTGAAEATWVGLGCVLILATLHSRYELNSDEGVVLHGAWHILNGRVPYTDFFEFVAPGSFYLVAAVWQLAGDSYWIAKFLGIAAIGASAAGVYCISGLVARSDGTQLSPKVRCAGPLALCMFSAYWPAINHNTFSVAPMVWSAYFMCLCIERRSALDAGWAGLLCGICAVLLQHRGAILAAVSLVFLLVLWMRDRDRAWLRATAVFFGAFAVLPLSLLLAWPPGVLFDHLIAYPAKHYMLVNQVGPWIFIHVCSVVLAAAWLIRRDAERRIGWLVALQVALLATALQRPDIDHLSPVLFPLLALLPLITGPDPFRGPGRSLRFWIGGSLAGLCLPVLLIAGFRMTGDRPVTGALIDYVRTRCTASPYLYAGPFEPGLYHATRQLNPTRYPFLLTNMNTPAQFDEARAQLAGHPPQCVVTNYAKVEKFGYDRSNAVEDYIAQNYAVAFALGGYEVRVRRRS